MTSIQEMLETYQPEGEAEAADVARVRALLQRSPDPYPRALPLHLTGSALVVHPDSGRVLLRWHPRQQAWLQVGGHGDPGERDPLGIARREAAEETGLTDLVPWPDAQLRHVVIVAVPAAARRPRARACRCALLPGHPGHRTRSWRSSRTRRCAG